MKKHKSKPRTRKIKADYVELICPECGHEIVHVGMMYDIIGGLYNHECVECGRKELHMAHEYPYFARIEDAD